jgi:predicted ATPase with chaperone activity
MIDLPDRESDLISQLGLDESFRPPEVQSLEETGLGPTLLESLVSKHLLTVGSDSGRRIADKLCVPFGILEPIYQSLRVRKLLSHTGSAPLNDCVYVLTEDGRVQARSEMDACSYVGPAPVPLEDYLNSVDAQTMRAESPKRAKLLQAFSDIVIDPELFNKIGFAINRGKGMFLYGPPGNGKTTLARRITACFEQTIMIPFALIEDGQLIKLFDASCHEPVESAASGILKEAELDRRWIRIRRPTVVVGGELTMDNLELTYDSVSKVSRAPLQMKSNCGCFLIDDFGRQRIEPGELLNRWIVPLENRIDYLTLVTGKKIQVPFEQLIIFSTNLEPSDLADDAFLRRIPYKIDVSDPSREEFHELFRRVAGTLDVEYRSEAVQYLIETHYKEKGRALRRCHPRDLLEHVESFCEYNEVPFEMTEDNLDRAVQVYFTVVSGE